MNRDNIDFLYNISNNVTLDSTIINELSDENFRSFIQSNEITSIGKTICSTINILLPFFSKIDKRLCILENIPVANITEAMLIKKPPSPKFPPPNIFHFKKKKKRNRHTR